MILFVSTSRHASFPELPTRIPLEEDFCESWGRFGDKKTASRFFEKGLKKSFASMNGKLKDDGLLVVFFAHSSTEAWNQLLQSIREGRLRVISSYAIHTESTLNPIARGKVSFVFVHGIWVRVVPLAVDDANKLFLVLFPARKGAFSPHCVESFLFPAKQPHALKLAPLSL